jgi:hypothetical protein
VKIINYDNKAIIKKLRTLIGLEIPHCHNCGHIFMNDKFDYDYGFWTTVKCSNPKCRKISRFVVHKGKVKLLTKSLVEKMPDENSLFQSNNKQGRVLNSLSPQPELP